MKLNKHVQSMVYNWPPKVLSLVFALCIYLFIQYTNIGSRVVTIPLDVKLPSAYEAESLVPSSVEVHIQGDDDLIYLINPNSILASLDFSYVQQEGIATAAVLLEYEQNMFESGGISLSANPTQFRVLFSTKGEL